MSFFSSIFNTTDPPRAPPTPPSLLTSRAPSPAKNPQPSVWDDNKPGTTTHTVTLLLDGNTDIFSSAFLCQGYAGGQAAARALEGKVKGWHGKRVNLRSGIAGLDDADEKGQVAVMVKVFADFNALFARLSSASGSAAPLPPFVQGFNSASIPFSMVDVGASEAAVADAINAHLSFFLAPSHSLILSCPTLSSSSYLSALRSLPPSSSEREKVFYLRPSLAPSTGWATSDGEEWLRQLGLEEVKLEGVFETGAGEAAGATAAVGAAFGSVGAGLKANGDSASDPPPFNPFAPSPFLSTPSASSSRLGTPIPAFPSSSIFAPLPSTSAIAPLALPPSTPSKPATPSPGQLPRPIGTPATASKDKDKEKKEKETSIFPVDFFAPNALAAAFVPKNPSPAPRAPVAVAAPTMVPEVKKEEAKEQEEDLAAPVAAPIPSPTGLPAFAPFSPPTLAAAVLPSPPAAAALPEPVPLAPAPPSPAPSVPPSDADVDAEAEPISTAEFDPLLALLHQLRSSGVPQPRRADVGQRLKLLHPGLYPAAGGFKEYVKRAVKAGLVEVGEGDVPGKEWIRLVEEETEEESEEEEEEEEESEDEDEDEDEEKKDEQEWSGDEEVNGVSMVARQLAGLNMEESKARALGLPVPTAAEVAVSRSRAVSSASTAPSSAFPSSSSAPPPADARFNPLLSLLRTHLAAGRPRPSLQIVTREISRYNTSGRLYDPDSVDDYFAAAAAAGVVELGTDEGRYREWIALASPDAREAAWREQKEKAPRQRSSRRERERERDGGDGASSAAAAAARVEPEPAPAASATPVDPVVTLTDGGANYAPLVQLLLDFAAATPPRPRPLRSFVGDSLRKVNAARGPGRWVFDAAAKEGLRTYLQGAAEGGLVRFGREGGVGGEWVELCEPEKAVSLLAAASRAPSPPPSSTPIPAAFLPLLHAIQTSDYAPSPHWTNIGSALNRLRPKPTDEFGGVKGYILAAKDAGLVKTGKVDGKDGTHWVRITPQALAVLPPAPGADGSEHAARSSKPERERHSDRTHDSPRDPLTLSSLTPFLPLISAIQAQTYPSPHWTNIGAMLNRERPRVYPEGGFKAYVLDAKQAGVISTGPVEGKQGCHWMKLTREARSLLATHSALAPPLSSSAATDAGTVSSRFHPLIRVVRSLSTTGSTAPHWTAIGQKLNGLAEKVYEEGELKTYMMDAVKAGVVEVGKEDDGKASGWWAKLTPAMQDVTLPALPKRPLPSRTPSSSTGASVAATVPSRFVPLLRAILVEQAKWEKPYFSQVGIALNRLQPRPYDDVGGMKEYVAEAVALGLVERGKGEKTGQDWLAVRPGLDLPADLEYPSTPRERPSQPSPATSSVDTFPPVAEPSTTVSSQPAGRATPQPDLSRPPVISTPSGSFAPSGPPTIPPELVPAWLPLLDAHAFAPLILTLRLLKKHYLEATPGLSKVREVLRQVAALRPEKGMEGVFEQGGAKDEGLFGYVARAQREGVVSVGAEGVRLKEEYEEWEEA
ncbi:hypothetical protein JCM10213_002854 [Rhodosporidiobolus nylandii]